jgi:MATE family multidrug resistance protein
MISTLASLFMIFTDRIFLAHYSIGALNACANAGTLAWAFMFGIGMVAAMSEVFVAQYNGAKMYQKIGSPVWQMVWVSLFSFIVFIPVAIWGSPLIFKDNLYAVMESQYFRWLVIFAPSYALLTAFSGFFIGRGKTYVLIWLAVIANILNIILDRILIFGIPGWVPEMGIQGAAIATCFGYFFQSIVLFFYFLSPQNRKEFGTGNWKIDFTQMRQCLKIGLPQGIFSALEVFGWAIFYWMMTSLSETHITVSSICQSFLILFSFFPDGLCRGAAAVAGNFIGSQRTNMIRKVLKSGFILLAYFVLATSLFLVVDPVDTAKLLFFAHFEEGNLLPSLDPSFATALRTCMIFSFIYFIFDGIKWILSGILIAAGDTMFILITGALSVWIFLLAPIYWLVVKSHAPVEHAWAITALYSAIFAIIYWARFRQGAWQKINLLGDTKNQPSPQDAFETPN